MKNTFTILLLAIGFSYFSQIKHDEFSVELGSPYPVLDGIKSYFSHEDKAVSFKYVKGGYNLQKYDTEKLTQESSTLYKDFPKNHNIIGVYAMDTKLYLIYFVEIKKVGYTIFSREISYETGKFVSEGKEIMKISDDIERSRSFGGGIVIGGGSLFYSENIEVFRSVDKKHICINYTLKKENRDGDDVVQYTVFNENLEKIWDKKVTFEGKNKFYKFVSIDIDKNGKIVALTKLFPDKRYDDFDRSGKPKFDVKLLTIDQNGLKTMKGELDLGTKYLLQTELYLDQKSEIYIVGMYANKYSSGSMLVDGYYAIRFNEDGTIKNKNHFEIPSSIIKEYMSERSKAKIDKKEEDDKEVGLTDLYLRKVIFQEDGGILFLAEKYFYRTRTDSKGNTSTTYYYMDMYLTKINGKNEIAWMKKFPKYQKGASTNDLGCKLIEGKNEHLLLFVDNAKNMNLTIDQVPEYHFARAGGYLTAYKISDKDGSFDKHYITDFRDTKGMELFDFQLSRIMDLNNNEFIVEFYKKGKEDILLKVKIN